MVDVQDLPVKKMLFERRVGRVFRFICVAIRIMHAISLVYSIAL